MRLALVGAAVAGLLAAALAPSHGAPAVADGPPVVRVNAPDEIVEGREVGVLLVLDGPVGHDVTVRVDTRAGTALAPGDYRGLHRRVRVRAGETVVRLALTTAADALDEPREGFEVRLSHPVGADLGRRRATVTIRDDDPLPRVRVADRTVTEPALGHRLGFTRVKLSAPSARRVVVRLATRSATATAGQDFVPLHPTVVFEPGDTIEPVSVELLSDDRNEPAETMRLTVTEASHATAARGATITILDAPGG